MIPDIRQSIATFQGPLLFSILFPNSTFFEHEQAALMKSKVTEGKQSIGENSVPVSFRRQPFIHYTLH